MLTYLSIPPKKLVGFLKGGGVPGERQGILGKIGVGEP